MRSLVFAPLLFLLACASPEETPEGILDRERFTTVLAGATLIEARMNNERVADHAAAIPMKAYYDELFREQGTDSSQFSRSFDHYASRPTEMKEIYDEVIERLRLEKDQSVPGAVLAKDTTLATDSASGMKR